MSFTLITVSGSFKKQNGTPAAGSIEFQLSSPLIDGSTNEIREAVPIKATLDANGAISVSLTATNDPTTTPGGVTYSVTHRVTDAPRRVYSIEVAYNAVGGTIDLADVIPVVGGIAAGIPDGTAALPAVRFASDPNTGLFRVSEDVLGISAGGAERVRVSTQGLGLQDGLVGTPSLFYTNDPNTGAFRAGADIMAITAGGVEVARFQTAAGVPQMLLPDGVVGSPIFGFAADPDTGFYRFAPDVLGISTGGVERMRVGAQVLLPDGVVGSPIFGYINDTDLGRWRIGANLEGHYGSLAIRGPHPYIDLNAWPTVGDGVVDDTAVINDAIAALVAVGGGKIIGSKTHKVTTLTMYSDIYIEGTRPSDRSGTGGLRFHGTAGFDVFNFTPTALERGCGLKNLIISGGRRGISATKSYVNWVFIEHVQIVSQTDASIYIEGGHEQWYLRNVSTGGAPYGFRKANVAEGGQNYIDQFTFENVYASGTINGVKIEGALSNAVTWKDCDFTFTGQDGVVADIGARQWTFLGCNWEGIGQNGKNNRTTGSITTGTPTLVVANATGYAEGDPVTVCGAGLNGADLTTTITTIVGTTFTLATNALTTVTSLPVTNASYDWVRFNNTIATSADITFMSCQGGEGTGGKARYSFNLEGCAGATFINTTNPISQPVYDPTWGVGGVGGSVNVRRSSIILSKLHTSLLTSPSPASGGEPIQRTTISSPPGGDILFGLRDATDAFSGIFGNIEVRSHTASVSTIFRLNGTTGAIGAANGALTTPSWSYFNDTNSGRYLVGADDQADVVGGLEIARQTNTAGTRKLSWFGVPAVARAAALTQTYATADRTHAAETAVDLATIAATQTTPWGFASAAQADAIATEFNKLRTDLRDLKQFVNAIADDFQAYGLEQ